MRTMHASRQSLMTIKITEYMIERFARLVPLISMVYTNILIDYNMISTATG